MENKSSNGWKFFALLFGGLLAALVGLYIYKQQNPDYDPWEEPWENSSSPVDLGLNKAEDEADDEAKAAPAESLIGRSFNARSPATDGCRLRGFLCSGGRQARGAVCQIRSK